VARLAARLQQLQPKLIDVESRGGYEHTQLAACREAMPCRCEKAVGQWRSIFKVGEI